MGRNSEADCSWSEILTDGNEHQNGGNCKRQSVAARVETEHVTCAPTKKTCNTEWPEKVDHV